MFRSLILGALIAAVGGCAGTNYLTRQYASPRPVFGDHPLPNPGPGETRAPLHIVNPNPSGPSMPEQAVTGIWTFTIPPTVTRVERKNGNFSQIALYNGRPAPADTPIVVISVSRDAGSISAADPETYHVTHTRSYLLNGNLAQEWTGRTDAGSGFCELVLSRPGAVDEDVCHAMAIARTDADRKLALAILSSLKWTANGSTGAADSQGLPDPQDSGDSQDAKPAANVPGSAGGAASPAPASPAGFQ